MTRLLRHNIQQPPARCSQVKSFPEAAAALAAADGGASLDRLVQQLEPVLQALKQLSHPAGRQSISTQLMLACLAKLVRRGRARICCPALRCISCGPTR